MAKLDYKTMTIDDIFEWCEANGQNEWLKAEGARMVKCKVYPKTTIIVDGKKKTIADKDAKPVTVERKITFIQIKKDFCKKFMPDIIPSAKPKKTTMYDRFAAL